METMIDLDRYGHVVFLTGAGVSVASGLRPYRGPNGLWKDETLVRLSHIETFATEPLEVWRHWWAMRALAMAAAPNAAHLALARLEAARPAGTTFTLVTQNVDGLHARAGSANVLEYHGTGLKTRCSNPSCALEPFVDARTAGDSVPECPLCSSPLRPDIVLFGEMIPARESRGAKRALDECDLFVAVGTSATVFPAASFARSAKYAGARTLCLNLEHVDLAEGDFDEEILGPAEETLPKCFGPTERSQVREVPRP
ncbi:MAG: hypothetical protein JNG85_11890 [Spirochaetaceae bacterium]|nr:hypothetical protein [Spirochaetaceae bacterium]